MDMVELESYEMGIPGMVFGAGEQTERVATRARSDTQRLPEEMFSWRWHLTRESLYKL